MNSPGISARSAGNGTSVMWPCTRSFTKTTSPSSGYADAPRSHPVGTVTLTTGGPEGFGGETGCVSTICGGDWGVVAQPHSARAIKNATTDSFTMIGSLFGLPTVPLPGPGVKASPFPRFSLYCLRMPVPKSSVIVSGIQPSGQLHVGNYVGAVRNWLRLQNEGRECFFFIADLHSITGDYDPDEKRRQVLDLATDLLALGLDPKKCTLFVQSHIPEHAELCWIFNTVTPVSFLERMTQFKDKSDQQAKNVNMGLFDYPVLQAADILMYRGGLVPVGRDQVQHVELTRDIARFFNNKFGDFFPETQPLLTEVPKLRSITDPLKKMSKSLGEKSYVAISDTPEDIAAKLKRAVTETTGVLSMTEEELEHRMSLHADAHEDETLKGIAGVWNLLAMLRVFGSPEEADRVFAAQPIKYGELKALVATRIAEHFADFRAKRAALAADPENVRSILADGAEKARKVATQTMDDVRRRVGLR